MQPNESAQTFLVSYPIPFYTQMVDFADEHLQGFRSKEDAEHWQVRGCGIASLKMVIDGFRRHCGEPPSEAYGELVYRGAASGAHCDKGWIHQGLVELAAGYRVRGKSIRRSGARDVLAELEQNRPCIVSVTAGFNGGKRKPDGALLAPGGHLIVALGYVMADGELQGFIVHHPSSYAAYNWERHFVRLDDFERSFSGAFLSFWL